MEIIKRDSVTESYPFKLGNSDSIHEYLVEETYADNRVLHFIYAVIIMLGMAVTPIYVTGLADQAARIEDNRRNTGRPYDNNEESEEEERERKARYRRDRREHLKQYKELHPAY